MEKTAIVIGSTGLIGSNLIEKLDKSDHIKKIKSVTRRKIDYSSKKIENIVVNFDELEKYKDKFTGDYLFSCMGTTKSKAGSIKAQKKVDLIYQYSAARLADENGVKGYFLVSSSGADKNSKSAYLKMKGELEEKIEKLSFKSINIFRPSLLIGKRDEFRFSERIGSYLLTLICILPFLKKYHPIKGSMVALKMVEVSKKPEDGLNRFILDEIFTNDNS